MPNAPSSELGGADPEALRAVARNGEVPDPDDDRVPWDSSWVERLDAWSEGEPEQAIILLFSTTPSVVGVDHGGKRLLLFAQGPRPQAGTYVVGRVGTTNAWHLPIEADLQAASSTIEQAATLKCLPAVVLAHRRRRMYYFPRGLGDHNGDPVEFRLDLQEPTLDWTKLEEQLRIFESECLNTQEVLKQIWAEYGKWYPIKEAELAIHDYLVVALRMVFRDYTTMSEVNLPNGRVDIGLQPRNLTEARRALLELKVLRTFSHTGDTTYTKPTWVSILDAGRTQATQYARQFGAEIRVLCTYDMRKDKTQDVLNEASTACTGDGVSFLASPVHNNVKAVRELASASATEDQ